MTHSSTILQFFLLLLNAGASLAQAPAARSRSATDAISNSTSILYPATVNLGLWQVSPENLVESKIYARNRVRTVTIVRQTKEGADTSAHFELDRRGNKIRIASPRNGRGRLQYFDKQNRRIEVVLTATRAYPVTTRTVRNPETKVITSYIAVRGWEPVLWQESQEYKRGDTAVTEAIFRPVLGLETGETRRIVSFLYPIGGDTLRYETIGYNKAGEPIAFSASYQIRRNGKTIETGHLSPQQEDNESAKPVIPANVLQLSRQQRANCVPTTRLEYNEHGQLIQIVAAQRPGTVEPEPQKQTSSRGSSQSRPYYPLCTITTRYIRMPDGRVKREELTNQLKPGVSQDKHLQRLMYTDYKYGSNGLLLSKTDNRSGDELNVYEVKYTFY